jgi:hypothetical protein
MVESFWQRRQFKLWFILQHTHELREFFTHHSLYGSRNVSFDVPAKILDSGYTCDDTSSKDS